jgi:hypothetical protein
MRDRDVLEQGTDDVLAMLRFGRNALGILAEDLERAEKYCVNVRPRIVGPFRSDARPCSSPITRVSALSNAVISTSRDDGSTPM